MNAMLSRIAFLLVCAVVACAQETPAENPQPKPQGSVSATTRLLNAKTIYIKQVAGNDIVFDVVNNAMLSWPRYIVVDSPEKADLLMEVSAPEDPNKKKKDDESKTSISGGSGRDPRAMTAPAVSYSSNDVKLVVRDPHTKAILWGGTELAKEAFRQAKTDQNLMDAAEKLVHKFRDRVEPTPPPVQ